MHGKRTLCIICKTFFDQVIEGNGCETEVLPGFMEYREKWKERVKNVVLTQTSKVTFLSNVCSYYLQLRSTIIRQWTHLSGQ